MPWRPGPRMIREPAPVELDDLAGFVEDRDHERAIEVLVPARAQEPQPLEPSPELGACLPIAGWQPIAERAVGEAELEVIDQLGRAQTAALEIPERLGTRLQRRVIVRDHLLEHLGVGRLA